MVPDVSPSLNLPYQRIALEAMKKGVTLNKYIIDVLEKETGKQKTA